VKSKYSIFSCSIAKLEIASEKNLRGEGRTDREDRVRNVSFTITRLRVPFGNERPVIVSKFSTTGSQF
jgi:hypothetical protein